MPAPSLILLVDGSDGSLLFNESVLRRRDRAIFSLRSGSDALEAIQSQQPRLVVFGYRLSDMTGPEFCRIVRADAEMRGTSLLFVADRHEASEADLCLGAGCNDVIYKPLQLQELDAKIERLTAIPVRKEVRTLTRLEVTVATAIYNVLGHSVNLSSSGILVQTQSVIAPDADLRVQFYLPRDPLPFDAPSRIIRAEFAGTAPRYGMQFVDM